MSSVQIEPMDEHNGVLVGNVHPHNWENPTPPGRYNLVVLGAGTGGLISAALAASLGAKVALVERHLMGGDCLNVGCVPSKGVISAARAYQAVREAALFGVRLSREAQVDFGVVMERMRRIRAEISHHDSAARYRDEFGVDVYIGEGRFSSPQTVEVDRRQLSFARAIIATGARAAVPPIPGLEEAGYLTNENLFTLTELPRRFAVVGSGPIGCEIAQSFSRFGAQVELIETAERILPREDLDVASILEARLRREGVNLRTGTGLERVSVSGGKKVLTLSTGEELVVDNLLLAVGRAPNVTGIGLEAAGVTYDKRAGVAVNSYLQSSNRRIYAVGDVAYQYKFTHAAEATAGIAVQNALFFRTKKADSLVIPWCTYTAPEVAHVGISEREAAKRSGEVITYTHDLGAVDRARLEGEGGLVKLHASRKGKLLGATIVAEHAGEMIGELVLAMQKGLNLGDLNEVVHPYPTQAEAIKRAAAGPLKARLTPT
ncbi:MAG: mercuric reductase, partial [Alkalispirochaetaceae bacterium]